MKVIWVAGEEVKTGNEGDLELWSQHRVKREWQVLPKESVGSPG